MEQLTIVKIGGKVIDDPTTLAHFLDDFSAVAGPKLLVHGGGKIASDLGKKMGIEPKYIEGRRITDAPTLDLVTMVYGGLINKQMVAALQSRDQNAIGLTGADGNVLPAKKRPVKEIDYGFAGDIKASDVNTEVLQGLVAQGLTPVFCALTHDQQGSMLNTNADTIACVLASALATKFQVSLVYCFEQPGVLSDFENKTVIPDIQPRAYESLKAEGIINEGMIPKLDNAFAALQAGTKEVRIGHFADLQELIGKGKKGTKITL